MLAANLDFPLSQSFIGHAADVFLRLCVFGEHSSDAKALELILVEGM